MVDCHLFGSIEIKLFIIPLMPLVSVPFCSLAAYNCKTLWIMYTIPFKYLNDYGN